MDTNVVIDFLANRAPFAEDAAKLFDFSAKGLINIYISAVSYNNIYYILNQSLSHAQTIYYLEELAEISLIVDTTNDMIRNSLKSSFTDYEDGIQYYSALSIPNIDFIVTRNTKDFRKSQIAVLSPSEAIHSLITVFNLKP
jgi:predicted nucleic acid-binding protein